MRVTVTTEQRFYIDAEGAMWTSGAFPYAFWTRYLRVFDLVQVVARAQRVRAIRSQWRPVNGPGVVAAPLPHYLGPVQYLASRSSIRSTLVDVLRGDGAVILRVPSPIATQAIAVMPRGRPFAVEVVGDPWDVFAPGSMRHPLRPALRLWMSLNLKRQCRHASEVAYVNQTVLPRRYPPGDGKTWSSYSSIELAESFFKSTPRTFPSPLAAPRLVFVGSLEQLYKGPDVLLRALASLRRHLPATLTIVGDGRKKPEVLAVTKSLELQDVVRLTGQLESLEAVRRELDAADLFVLPSRTEGLPRAMIEAMARGLPCIGSSQGGIPELLDPCDMVPAGDSEGLARKVAECVSDPRRLERMSERCLARARKYEAGQLERVRSDFYQLVRADASAWQPVQRR